jgi:hypothetical protein
MEIKVESGVIASNRKPISIVGSNLGGQYFNASAREAWPNYAEEKLNVEKGNNVELILNRSPRRYRMKGYDITSVIIAKDATGADKVFINKDQESEVSIPIAAGMEKVGFVTDDAIARALRGDKSMIFANAEKLAQQLNNYNMDEIHRLKAIIDRCNRMIQQIESSVAENNKKVNDYKRELLSSSTTIEPALGGKGTVEIVVEPAKVDDED